MLKNIKLVARTANFKAKYAKTNAIINLSNQLYSEGMTIDDANGSAGTPQLDETGWCILWNALVVGILVMGFSRDDNISCLESSNLQTATTDLSTLLNDRDNNTLISKWSLISKQINNNDQDKESSDKNELVNLIISFLQQVLIEYTPNEN